MPDHQDPTWHAGGGKGAPRAQYGTQMGPVPLIWPAGPKGGAPLLAFHKPTAIQLNGPFGLYRTNHKAK